MLKDHGFEVVETSCPLIIFLKIFKKHDPDSILVEIRLNGKIDRKEAARILRKESPVPVIFISAFNDEVTRDNIGTIANSMLVNKHYEIS